MIWVKRPSNARFFSLDGKMKIAYMINAKLRPFFYQGIVFLRK